MKTFPATQNAIQKVVAHAAAVGALAFIQLLGAQTAPGIPIFRPGDIPNGLQGWWKFDNNANDSSSSGYNLIADGSPTYSDDDYWALPEKSVIYGGGTGHHIAHASGPGLNIQGAEQSLTVSAWIKLSSGAENFVANKYAGPGGYILGINSATTLEFSIANGGTSGQAGGYPLSVGRWYHACGVYDASIDKLLLYVDGNLVRVVSYSGGIGGNTADFKTGINYTGGDVFDGNIKDLAVWNTNLTSLQIKSLALGVDLAALAFRPGNVSVLPTAWWKLNEISDGSSPVERRVSARSHPFDRRERNSRGARIR
jgi:hypothetical protein